MVRGRKQLRLGRFDEAQQSFNLARRDHRLVGPALIGLAQVEFQKGNALGAEAYAKVALETSSRTAAQLMLANMYFKRHDYRAAIPLYRQVLARRPGHGEAQRNLRMAQHALEHASGSRPPSGTASSDAAVNKAH